MSLQSSPRSSPASPPGPWRVRDEDLAHAENCERAKKLIEEIRKLTADILREAEALGTASSCHGGQKKVGEAQKRVKHCKEEADRLLTQLPVSRASKSEATRCREEQEKLREDLAAAHVSMRDASAKYEAARRARNDRDEAATRAALSAVSVSAQGGAVGVAIDPAGAQQAQLREQLIDDVSQAEVETHAEHAAEYAQEASRLESSVRDMNRVVGEMARVTTQQGEQVENILSFMESASVNTADAREELDQSNVRHRRGTKSLLLLVLLAVVVAVLICAVVLVKRK